MPSKDNMERGASLLLIAASFVIIIWGIYQAQSILVLMLVALFLSVVSAPPVLWLKEKGIPSALAVLTVLTGMILIFLMIGGLVGASIASFSESLPVYQKLIEEKAIEVKTFLAGKGLKITNKSLYEYMNPAAIMNITAGLLSGLTSTLSSIFLILLTVTFTLLEVSSFPEKIRKILNDPKAAFPQFAKFVEDINRYMVIKTSVSVTTGVLIGTWMAILGVDFPILWGFIAFLLNYVPNIGVVIAAFPAVLLTLIQYGTGHAIVAALGYLIVNFVVGTIVEPKLVGKGVGLSTLVVFLSLVFWGNLLGLIGMVLCIPLTMTLKFALENNEGTEWVAVLIDSETEHQKKKEKGKKK